MPSDYIPLRLLLCLAVTLLVSFQALVPEFPAKLLTDSGGLARMSWYTKLLTESK